MLKKFVLTTFVLSILASCASGGDGREASAEMLELFRAVPSEAVLVAHADRLDSALGMALDSSNVMRCLNWGRLEGRESVVSLVFNSKLSPVLCVDAGRGNDTLEVVKSVLGMAASNKLSARFVPSSQYGLGRNILLVSQSEAVLSSVERHLDAGRSIGDNPSFISAYSLVGTSDAVFICNSAWDKIVPRKYLGDMFNRRELVKFAQNASDWTVIVPGDKSARVLTLAHNDESQFSNVLDVLPGAESTLSSMLPAETTFAFSLPVGPWWRDCYRNWRYACSNLDKYEKELARLKKSSGADPLEWERRMDVKEIGLVQWGRGRRVILLRSGRTEETLSPSHNPYSGFLSALYGSAFSVVTDSTCVKIGDWTVSGSLPDVEAYLESIPSEIDVKAAIAAQPWPAKGCKFAFYQPGRVFYADRKGMSIKMVQQ